MTLKRWFIEKNFSWEQQRALNCGYTVKVLKETEKAYYVALETDFGKIRSWIPKSVIQ